MTRGKLHLAAQLLGILVLVLVGARTGKLLRTYTAKTSQIRATLVSALAKPGIELGNLNGIALTGQYVDPAGSDRTRIVFFLLRARTAAADLQFWNRVATALGGQPWLQFRGFCETSACAAIAHSPKNMLILQAGALRTLQAVVQADRQGKAVLVTAADHRETATIPWRNAPSSARFQSEILGATSWQLP